MRSCGGLLAFYREQLRNILDRKQINIVSTMLASRISGSQLYR
jgi:hypothetical protein